MIRFTLIVLLFLSANFMLGQTIEDEQTVIQMSIDLPALQPYYRAAEVEALQPLIIADEGVVPTELTLTKFGKPVEFIPKPDLFFQGEQAFLDFDKFEITPVLAEVVFHYAVAGLTVSLIFEKAGADWLLKTRTLTVE